MWKDCEAVRHTLYGGAVEQRALQSFGLLPIDNHLLCSSAVPLKTVTAFST